MRGIDQCFIETWCNIYVNVASVDNKLQVLLLLNSLSNSWKTLVVSPRNYALKDVLQLAMFNDSLIKKLEEMTWVRIMHKLLSQKTRGEVKVLRGALNPKVD